MTIQDLIQILEKVEDKQLEIVFSTNINTILSIDDIIGKTTMNVIDEDLRKTKLDFLNKYSYEDILNVNNKEDMLQQLSNLQNQPESSCQEFYVIKPHYLKAR